MPRKGKYGYWKDKKQASITDPYAIVTFKIVAILGIVEIYRIAFLFNFSTLSMPVSTTLISLILI